MQISQMFKNAVDNVDIAIEGARIRNPRVLAGLVGPATRGLVLQEGRKSHSEIPAHHTANFQWGYQNESGPLNQLYAAAKRDQWDAASLAWDTPVDIYSAEVPLAPEHFLPLCEVPTYRRLDRREQDRQRAMLTAWLMSQFLHGEQGALFAACQITESVPGFDAKLMGSTQVVDEGRHVEVFHRYLKEKLERVYIIDDNLFVLIDALMRDAAWDVKFLGMQIMIEGLALGSFTALRQATREPLLRELLKYVITDEARHVHYGVVALADHFKTVPEALRRDREDWVYEIAVLMRNRFLAHEFYDENYAHCMSRKAWDALIAGSDFMRMFRETMFRRILPNLSRIGLLSDRIKPHYEALGVLQFEKDKPTYELSANELYGD
jgi:hypothetical protein